MLRNQKKEKQTNPKANRRKHMIKCSVGINEIENKNNRENQGWFSENISKSDKPLARLTKKIRKKIQIVKTRNERKDIPTDPIGTKSIVYYSYYE